MARPRDFDVDEALLLAMRVFWARGYAATGVRELCDAMGIKPGSFYAAFESKEACFRRALERYFAEQNVPAKAEPRSIRAWFDAILDPRRSPRGCLLVNSMVELPSLDEESRALVAGRARAVEDFFRLCLRGRKTAREDAALLAAAVVAIHVLSRSGAPSSSVRRVAKRALAAAGLA